MIEKEYKEYIEECDKSIDDFNRIAKRLGVDSTDGDVPINMVFVLKLLRAIEKVLDSQPCEDAVSRQAVLEELPRRTMKNYFGEVVGDVVYIDDIKNLPPVTPKRPKGHWIAQDIHNCHTNFRCSWCGYEHDFIHLYGEPTADYAYCPNCGADMREGEL